MRIVQCLSVVGAAFAPAAALAIVTGALDPTFGAAGKANVAGYGLSVQADGKIVAATGAAVIAGGTPPVTSSAQLGLARLTTTGGMEFSRADEVGNCQSFACMVSEAVAGGVLVQPDGAIVTAGGMKTADQYGGSCARFKVRRYLAGGSPDPAFGAGGLASFGAGYANAVAIQPDGRLVVAGVNKNYSCTPLPGGTPSDDFSVGRLTTSGEPDATFGTNGVASVSLGGAEEAATAIAIRPDGKIVLGGYASNGANRDFAVAIYSAAGVLESNALHDLGADDVAYALALQPDGKILMGGSAGSNFVLVRVTAPGAYDSTFGAAGRMANPGAPIRAIALQPDGKIIAAQADGDVLRFEANGPQDASFGISGRVSTGMTDVLSLALQADGKILVGSATQVARIDPAATAPIAPAPTVVYFFGQSLHTTSPPQAVQLTNATGSTQTISSIAAPTGFGVTHDCTTLAAGASCTATVTYTPVLEGSTAADLVVTGSAGTQKVYLLGLGERSLTTHYYQAILRRAPDAPGKAFWESEAARMVSIGANVNEAWYAMAQFFFFSEEYLNLARDDNGFVTDLYTTFFNRAPDAGGLGFWAANLQQGMPREVLLASFMFSVEFGNFTQAIFGNTAARAEVDVVMDFYRGLLTRLPDPGGFTAWVNNFRAAQCQGTALAVNDMAEAISSGFANSGEYLGKNRTNSQFVGDLYNAFLRRGGDLPGVQFWINELNTAARTRENVRQQFLVSTEFQGRVNAIVAQGCLP
jgi:uncharacterized delta-60 repeat protein